ncbi:hypothetical protein WSM22_33840 [Cytophagales bacterium WSM2-2]|nr:hypothetical protein WSM22_33840 [Cytophagales bacterium WSM2-2]
MKPKGTLKVCINGHKYYKSSDCPTCPVCESDRKPQEGFLSHLSAPARRALEGRGILTLKELAVKTEDEIMQLHGMGPSTLPKLKRALKEEGLAFKREKRPNSKSKLMQKIVTSLWFDNQAEEAAGFYVSLFKNSKVASVMKIGGKTLSVNFILDGQEYLAINDGPKFNFTEAISLFVKCETQAEIDRLWNKLTSGGGKESMCGWLKDKYGLSWQIVPPLLIKFLQDKDSKKSKRVMDAMLQMRKIDIAVLKKAYNG